MSSSQIAPLSRLSRWALGLTLFTGIGAMVGVGMMWIAPEAFGMEPLLEAMHNSLPLADVFFTGFLWPGLLLLVIIGVPHLIAAGLIWRRHRLAPLATLVCGLILMGWIIIQFVIWPLNPLSVIFFVVGFAEAIIGWRMIATAKPAWQT